MRGQFNGLALRGDIGLENDVSFGKFFVLRQA
jgi:hypothetical protein